MGGVGIESFLAHGADHKRISKDPIYTASLCCLNSAIKVLLARGFEIKRNVGQLGSALHVASTDGHASIVELLVVNGANVNARNNQGSPVFMAAGAQGHLPILNVLLEFDADVHIVDNQGSNALIAATSNGHAAVVHALLFTEEHTDIRNRSEFNDALRAAYDNNAIVKQLLNADADPNLTLRSREPLLHVTCLEKSTEVIKPLLGCGADVHVRARYPNALVAVRSCHEINNAMYHENARRSEKK